MMTIIISDTKSKLFISFKLKYFQLKDYLGDHPLRPSKVLVRTALATFKEYQRQLFQSFCYELFQVLLNRRAELGIFCELKITECFIQFILSMNTFKCRCIIAWTYKAHCIQSIIDYHDHFFTVNNCLEARSMQRLIYTSPFVFKITCFSLLVFQEIIQVYIYDIVSGYKGHSYKQPIIASLITVKMTSF